MGEARGAVNAPDGSVAKRLPGEEGYPEEPADRLEPFNQAMFTFNRKADDWVLRPIASKWADVMPQPARVSVGRFFKNVGVIPRFANDLFQFQFKQGAQKWRVLASIAPWASLDCSIPLINGLVLNRQTMIWANAGKIRRW